MPERSGSEPMVSAVGIHKSFGRVEVLRGVDLTVMPGEVACVIGPSGSGKSTFLRCINHLETIDAGSMTVAGELIGYRRRGDKLYELRESEVARQRRDIGMVFQRFNLFPHMTALQNVMEAPCTVRRTPKKQVREAAAALLDRVGLGNRRDNYPSQLSGGQQQRVAIARALVNDPVLMLFDEVTSALDPELVGEVLAMLRDLKADGMTMVVATHEMGFARQVADEVCFLDGGRVLERGAPERVLGDPEHERTRRFLRRIIEAGRL